MKILSMLACVLMPVAVAMAQPAAPLEANLGETIVEVPSDYGLKLKTTIFKPPGDGPFPLVLMNHGKAFGNPQFQPRARYLNLAAEMVRMGYAVVVPNRKGVAGSAGVYIGSGCGVLGMGNAQADDVKAVLDWAVRQPFVDPARIVLMGQSHGGMTVLAFAARPAYPGVRGLVNFAGGNKSPDCNGWENNMRDAFGEWGRNAAYPALWFYGENDSFFPPPVYRPAYAAHVAAGAKAELIEFGRFAPGDAHDMAGHFEGVPIWLPKVRAFLGTLGLPNRALATISREPMPGPGNFARIDAVEAVPNLSPQGRENYRRFLSYPGGRAFVLTGNGRHWWALGGADPVERALANCRKAAEDCALYAVGDDVVWVR